MFHSILIAFDGSEPSSTAFDYALDLAQRYQATLTLLSVARPPEPASDAEAEAMLENAQEHFAADFSHLMARAVARGVTLACQVRVGHPTEQILYMVDEIHADLVVMGRRGLSFFDRWHFGSVSKQVMVYAACPVLIVR
jgi:nucleotide-binding universal stress UspA family protein